jgi:BMFP domain-containing protein YqiC
MSDPLQTWLASQREFIERWLAVPHAGASPNSTSSHSTSSDAGGFSASADAAAARKAADDFQGEVQRWWQAVSQDASPQAQALARELMTLGPGFLAGTGDALFELFGTPSVPGTNATGFGRWAELAPIGYFREHQAHAQELARAIEEYRRVAGQMSSAISRIHTNALELLASKTQSLAAAGHAVSDTRQLYNLWIEAGEQAFAELARGDIYGRLLGELVNASARLRMAQQTIAEQFLKSLDLPTRAELNSVHKKLIEMRDRIESLEASGTKKLSAHNASHKEESKTKAKSAPKSARSKKR